MRETVTISPINYVSTNGCKFYSSFKSTETFLVQIANNNPFEMFCHENQTDQLIPVDGTAYLFYLDQFEVKYVTMSVESPVMVTIPPRVVHGSINVSGKPASVVNALIRHHDPAPNDYVPITRLAPNHDIQYEKLVEHLRSKHNS
jgi:uncharacterized RmlC-like cupin family protein